MKLLNLLALVIAVGGCSYLPFTDEPPPTPDQGAAETAPAAIPEPGADQEQEQEQANYLSVEDWLLQRQSACDLPRDAIDAQLARYAESVASLSPEEKTQVVHAYSQLRALMLASCNPARTPGLLKNFLGMLRGYTHWPPEYDALFDLLASERGAYALLERKYRELEARHQKTIEGIGNIERSLESQTDPGS